MIRVHDKKPDVRLVGFNAPETRRALCQAERELGAKAKQRVLGLVQSANLDFEFVACSLSSRHAKEPRPATTAETAER
jgi:endonuclease YncB( thermonuclease family)